MKGPSEKKRPILVKVVLRGDDGETEVVQEAEVVSTIDDLRRKQLYLVSRGATEVERVDVRTRGKDHRADAMVEALAPDAKRGRQAADAHRQRTAKAVEARKGSRKVSDDHYHKIRIYYQQLVAGGESRTNACRMIAKKTWKDPAGKDVYISQATALRYTKAR